MSKDPSILPLEVTHNLNIIFSRMMEAAMYHETLRGLNLRLSTDEMKSQPNLQMIMSVAIEQITRMRNRAANLAIEDFKRWFPNGL